MEYAVQTLHASIILLSNLKPGSQNDACASVALRASGWRWNRLNFYSSIASRALASVQPIRLSKNLTSGMQFDGKKNTFFRDAHDARSASVILWTRLNITFVTWCHWLSKLSYVDTITLKIQSNIPSDKCQCSSTVGHYTSFSELHVK